MFQKYKCLLNQRTFFASEQQSCRGKHGVYDYSGSYLVVLVSLFKNFHDFNLSSASITC